MFLYYKKESIITEHEMASDWCGEEYGFAIQTRWVDRKRREQRPIHKYLESLYIYERRSKEKKTRLCNFRSIKRMDQPQSALFLEKYRETHQYSYARYISIR